MPYNTGESMPYNAGGSGDDSSMSSAGDPGQRLRQAAMEGDVAGIQAALAEGAKVDDRGLRRDTALICAATNGHEAAIQVGMQKQHRIA